MLNSFSTFIRFSVILMMFLLQINYSTPSLHKACSIVELYYYMRQIFLYKRESPLTEYKVERYYENEYPDSGIAE